MWGLFLVELGSEVIHSQTGIVDLRDGLGVLSGLVVVATVVGGPRTLLLVPVSDLHLQVTVGSLQRTYFQVGGQAIAEIRHGHLLVACQQPIEPD